MNVSIILINYNSSECTINCIKSIQDKVCNNLNYEIILVDNNSQQADYEKLAVLKQIPNLTLIRSDINTGFAGGNMIGVEKAKGEYFFFLNNDCLLINDCLSIFKEYLDSNPKVGLISGQMFDENKNLQKTFGNFPTISEKFLGKGFAKLITNLHFYKDGATPQNPFPVDLVSGSAMFTRAELFKRVGGLDLRYFLYCEEEDYALTLKKTGHATYVLPEAKFIHIGGGSSDRRSLALEKEFFISLFLYLKKHYSLLKYYLFRIYFISKTFKRMIRGDVDFSFFKFIIAGAPKQQSLRYKQ